MTSQLLLPLAPFGEPTTPESEPEALPSPAAKLLEHAEPIWGEYE